MGGRDGWVFCFKSSQSQESQSSRGVRPCLKSKVNLHIKWRFLSKWCLCFYWLIRADMGICSPCCSKLPGLTFCIVGAKGVYTVLYFYSIETWNMQSVKIYPIHLFFFLKRLVSVTTSQFFHCSVYVGSELFFPSPFLNKWPGTHMVENQTPILYSDVHVYTMVHMHVHTWKCIISWKCVISWEPKWFRVQGLTMLHSVIQTKSIHNVIF